ncbi:MAG TPA: hypothetical protein VLH84_00175 [Patescibacteria group bacterium]|nr:hypothetical protein [Patescibacteria group bacterium]
MSTNGAGSPLETSRQVLRRFVADAEQVGDVQSFRHLQDLVSPDVASALLALILLGGEPPELRHQMAVLTEQRGKSKFEGIVASGSVSGDPETIHVAEYKRVLVRERRVKLLVLKASGNVGFGSVAIDERGFYLPDQVSDNSIGFLRDEVGEGLLYFTDGNPETGLEIAGRALQGASETLNGFLRVTAQLTSGLVGVEQPPA